MTSIILGDVGARLRVVLATMFLYALIVPAAYPAVITISAPEISTAGFDNSNHTVKGFRFSVNCHFHVRTPPDWPVAFLGMDRTSCGSIPDFDFSNPDYLGPGGGSTFGNEFYIDAGGMPFTLLNLAFWGCLDTVTSSKGGVVHGGTDCLQGEGVSSFSFSGPEWASIKSLLWTQELFDLIDSAHINGFISWTFRIPEPGTLVLITAGLGLLAMSALRRRPSM